MKLGIIGLNEGNGHPYSYSAIFNGYDPEALQRECPFALIKDYLPRDHQNKNGIRGPKVTHIWTQDRALSESVCRVSLIPNIVNHYEDLIGQVDGVILARDDIENHLEMARPFLKKRVPLFIDKQLVARPEDLKKLFDLCGGPDYPLMACSAVRYNPKVREYARSLGPTTPLSIQGISRVNWIRYAHHLFEAIAVLFGLDIEHVRHLGFNAEHESYVIQYRSGLTVTLEFHLRVSLPIRCHVNFEGREPLEIRFDDFFHSFKGMLEDFVKVVETGRPVIPHREIAEIACVVLAGVVSKEKGGRPVSPQEMGNPYAHR